MRYYNISWNEGFIECQITIFSMWASHRSQIEHQRHLLDIDSMYTIKHIFDNLSKAFQSTASGWQKHQPKRCQHPSFCEPKKSQTSLNWPSYLQILFLVHLNACWDKKNNVECSRSTQITTRMTRNRGKQDFWGWMAISKAKKGFRRRKKRKDCMIDVWMKQKRKFEEDSAQNLKF